MMIVFRTIKKTSFSIMAMAVCLSSCSNKLDDIYDPSFLQEAAKENFPVKNVDPTHTWETVGICTASITINENIGEDCTLNFYNGNPYSKTEHAYLMAQVNAKGGETVEKTFDMPSALNIIYITKVNKNGYSSTIPTVIENGKITASFGATAENVARSRAGIMTRAIQGVWTPEEQYKNMNNIPSDATDFSLISDQWNNVKANANYEVTNAVTSINIGQGVNLFITGDDVKWNSFYVNGASNIIIMPGAKLTAPYGWSYNNTICHIYNLGTLELTGCNWSNLKVYNARTIHSTGVMDINNTTEFINDGTINCESTLKLSNGTSVLVNDGTINAKDFGTEGSSKFYNESTGTVTIEETTTLNSNDCTWNNDGSFTTKYMNLASTSSNWTNSCKLYVTEKMTIATSSAKFNMNGGSYAEIKDLYMNESRINMSSEAYIHVTNEAKFQHNSYNQYYAPNSNGIYGTGEKPALIRMKKVVADNIGQRGTITYSGNLKVACDDHFAMGHDDNVDHLESANIMVLNGATMSKEDECDIHLEETECRPGYKPTEPTPVPEETELYTYAFEDMTQKEAGDYDMNDVVLKVSAPINQKVKVKLVAAGAIRNLSVRLKDHGVIFSEVHQALGVKEGVMVNTGNGTANADVKETEITVKEGFSLSNDGDFYITDLSNNREVHIPAFTPDFAKGDIPYAIRIPSDWKYPTERTKITEAYTGFEAWAQDATQETAWYNDEPVSGKTKE